MSEEGLWMIDTSGALTRQAGSFRMLVERVNGAVRFIVLRDIRTGDAPRPVILASGMNDNVRSAMAAAVRTAERLAAVDTRRVGTNHSGPPADRSPDSLDGSNVVPWKRPPAT